MLMDYADKVIGGLGMPPINPRRLPNRRNSGSRGLVFRRLLEQAVLTGPVPEAEVTFGYDWS
jgi:hypothetical protein